ncbi:MAG: hypothetical protein CMQ45_03795 [Gammaproteobacteria bacterium]|nr:hypothetical protein [Gammaproteobacteria bacterium]
MRILIAFLLCTCYLQRGLAQSDEGEVIVISELNRAEVKQFIEEAENQFYEIFNANIDDDDFRITCRRETPTGSNIPVRICEPKFMIDARARNANNFGFNPGVVEADRAIRTSVEPQYRKLQQMMEQMTQEVPAFSQIASILAQLRARQEQLLN